MDPHSSADVSVIFNPSALGPSDHTTDLAFTSKQVSIILNVRNYFFVYCVDWATGV